MPQQSTRDDSVKERRKTNGYSPYDQSGRKSKMTASRSWSPSIWSALTFWKSGRASSEDEEEIHEEDAPHDPGNGTNGGVNGVTGSDENMDGDPNDLSHASNLSEGQVSAHLTLEPPRHLPASATPVKTNPLGGYVAPVPPSSPLRNLANPQQDPLAQVAEFIASRDGRPLNQIEALGLNTLIQQSVHDAGRPTAAQHIAQQRSTPFFLNPSGSVSSSVSPSPPPIRPTFTSPKTDFASLFASPSAPSASGDQSPSSGGQGSPSTSRASPSRTLTRNPNGSLYYLGGGSARPKYRSSAFSASPTRPKITFPRGFGESPKPAGSAHRTEPPSPSDGKRRRVGEDPDSSTAQPSGSSPAIVNGSSSVGRTQGTPPAASSTLRFGVSSGSRAIPNTPARPSPLRQSVRADSSSPGSASPSTMNGGSPRGSGDSPSRAKASEIMAGIINDATPKKDTTPDVRNPYQVNSRSPTKRSRKPATKAPRPPPRPTRSTGTPPPPPPKKLSALETIQQTAPKAQTGSKRSHTGTLPPAAISSTTNGIHASSGSVGGNARPSADKPVVIEIDDEDEDEEQMKRPTKKQKQDSGEKAPEKESKTPPTSTTIEVEDVDMNSPASASASENIIRPSEVVEPEVAEPDTELQNQLESKRPVFAGSLGKKVPTARFQSAPKEPSPLRQSFQPDTPSSPPKDASPASPKPSAFVPLDTKSPFTLTAPSTFAPASAPSHPTPTSAPISETSAPISQTFVSFAQTSGPITQTSGPTSGLFMQPTAPLNFVPQSLSIAPGPPVYRFPPASEASTSTSDVAPSPSTSATPATDWRAVAKQQVIDTPVDKLPVFVFNFTSNIAVVDDYKSQRDAACVVPVHDLPKFDFSVVTAPKPKIKAFDYAAAGMKLVAPSGWRCSLCAIMNDDKLTECMSCQTAK